MEAPRDALRVDRALTEPSEPTAGAPHPLPQRTLTWGWVLGDIGASTQGRRRNTRSLCGTRAVGRLGVCGQVARGNHCALPSI